MKGTATKVNKTGTKKLPGKGSLTVKGPKAAKGSAPKRPSKAFMLKNP